MNPQVVNELWAQGPALLAIIGALAAIVSLITEVIKGVGVFNKIPTDLVVFVLSIILSVVALFAYASYQTIALPWYAVVAAIVVGFIVAFIAMYGWEKFREIWKRFNIK